MSDQLCISVRFLQPLYHGRDDGGEPEWPPSPLRMYQALVSAAAGRWNERVRVEFASRALQWLEQNINAKLPMLRAIIGVPSASPYRLYVPDNIGDKVAKSWSAGGQMDFSKYRPDKDVRPTHLAGDAVHYLFPLTDHCPHFDVLRDAARSITHLGWGIDMVAGDASILSEEEVAKLPGEVWRPNTNGAGTPLRVPIRGTLEALMSKHEAFLNRLSSDGFKPVPPLSAFRVVHYSRPRDVAPRPFVAFDILKPDQSGYRAFDTIRRCKDVAAWVRHAASRACEGWPFGGIEGFVHGHDGPGKPLKGERADDRFMYLPLPSIEYRGASGVHVGAIRRVLITAPSQYRERVDWIRRRLSSTELMWNDEPVGVLNLIPTPDRVVQHYLGASRIWSTVTPVVWPGHDDRDDAKAESILRKAFVQAGLTPELVGTIEDLAWRPVGFRPGVDLASRYERPSNMKGRAYHVRVRFPHPIPGPLAVGAGRYRGFGLFAAEQETRARR